MDQLALLWQILHRNKWCPCSTTLRMYFVQNYLIIKYYAQALRSLQSLLSSLVFQHPIYIMHVFFIFYELQSSGYSTESLRYQNSIHFLIKKQRKYHFQSFEMAALHMHSGHREIENKSPRLGGSASQLGTTAWEKAGVGFARIGNWRQMACLFTYLLAKIPAKLR